MTLLGQIYQMVNQANHTTSYYVSASVSCWLLITTAAGQRQIQIATSWVCGMSPSFHSTI